MSNVPHDAVHCSSKVDFIFVVHGDANKELCFSCCAPNVLAQLVSSTNEVIRITSHGRVSHMRELGIVLAW